MSLRLLSLLFSFVVCGPARADAVYRFVLVYDHDARELAESYVSIMRSTEPFRSLGKQVDIKLQEGTVDAMDCHPGCAGVERFICCSPLGIAGIAAPLNPNRILVFTSVAAGGATGAYPVAGVGYPPTTQFHEMLHTFGFTDEYDFTGGELKANCPQKRSQNVSCFPPKPRYANDRTARAVHMQEIPWFSSIEDGTLITNSGQTLLGTGKGYPWNKAALYQGGGCNKVSPCWRPYVTTIMRDLSSPDPIVPPYFQQKIRQQMESELGQRFFSVRRPLQGAPPAKKPDSPPAKEPESGARKAE
ncbi:MAG TPA: hypothetical protein VIH99_11350 [Bdellovibrionota bacterium]